MAQFCMHIILKVDKPESVMLSRCREQFRRPLRTIAAPTHVSRCHMSVWISTIRAIGTRRLRLCRDCMLQGEAYKLQ